MPVTLYQEPKASELIAAPPEKTIRQHTKVPENPPPVAPQVTPTESPLPAEIPPDLHANTSQLPDTPDQTEPAGISTATTSAATTTPAATALLTKAPFSVSYTLDVVRTEAALSNPILGVGEIHWDYNDQHYTMSTEAGIDLLFTKIILFSLHSEGTIGATGIIPKLTTEIRHNHPAASTYFNYELNTISFSASPLSLPLITGVQDKATVFMQLASIGNADPQQYTNGKTITIQVAEEKEANLVQFIILEQETIATKLGQLHTWHVVRPPRPGVYNSRLDIWLCPELHWIPVQIRNTESNGAVTTQTIRKITVAKTT